MKAEHIKMLKDMIAQYEEGESTPAPFSESDDCDSGQDFEPVMAPDIGEEEEPEAKVMTGGPDTSKGGKVSNDKSTRLKLLAGLLRKKMNK